MESKSIIKKDNLVINLLIIILSGLAFLVRLIPAIAQNFAAAGDSYMAVLWSRIIGKTGQIPDYAAIAEYWGKPGNIYFTPNLHILLEITHLLTGLSFSHAVIFLSLVAGTAIVVLLFVIARFKDIRLAVLVLLLSTAGLGRSLRYFTEPGYHFQNLFGDLIIIFLIYLFFVFIRYIKSKSSNAKILSHLALTLLTVNALLFYHQLSSFIGFIIIGFIFIVSLLSDKDIKKKIINIKSIVISIASFLLFVAFIFLTGYESTVWQLFGKVEYDDYLYKLMRSWETYPKLLGNDFVVYLGIFSFLFLVGRLIYLIVKKKKYFFEAILLTWFLIPLILSKAPLLYIKLLPLRLFWYIGYPLVIVAAYGLYYLIKKISWKFVIVPLVIITFFVVSFSSLFKQAKQEDYFYGMDSSYGSEVQSLSDWLVQNVDDEDVLYIDVFHYKSLIWVWSDVMPEKKVYLKVFRKISEYFTEEDIKYRKRVYIVAKRDERLQESLNPNQFPVVYEKGELLVYRDINSFKEE